MAKKIKNRSNAWFWAFWVLLLTILLALVFALATLFHTDSTADFSNRPAAESRASFDVVLTRAQINAIAAKFIKQQKIKNLSLNVASQQVDLYGRMKFLGSNINIGVALTPSVAADGSVVLKATRLVAGSMPLPIPFVMHYIESTNQLPAFIKINSGKRTMRIDMAKMKTGRLLTFRAKTIDLKKDKIIFQGDLK